MASKGQIQMIRVILRKHQYSEADKKQLVSDFTGGRTEHISDMENGEVNALKSFFQPAATDIVRDKMIRNLLAIAHEMKWELENGKADRERLSNWCKLYGPTKQPLDQIATNDLPKVLTIFKKVHETVLKDF